MTPLVISGILFYVWSRLGFLIGLSLLVGLLIYFTGELGLSLSFSEQFLLVSSTLAMPLGFYLAGSYLDNFLTDRFSIQLPLAVVFCLFGTYLVIDRGLFLEQLEHSINLVEANVNSSALLLFLENLSKTLMVTTGTILIILFLSLVIILPIAWLNKNIRLNPHWEMCSINLLLVLFLIATTYQLILSRLLS